VVLALRACIHAEFHTASVSRHYLMLDEVFLFIQAHLTEELTLERLEKEFFVSREHIAREFKRQTGQTVHRYIVKARLDQGAVRPLLHPHRAGAAHHRSVQDQRLWRLQPLFPRL